MAKKENILISLDSCHAKKIYSGSKRVELRRRTMHIPPGTTMWIYEKIPVGSITGSATVTAIYTASPEELWGRFRSISGLPKAEFFDYFANVKVACALVLDNVQNLHSPLSLKSLREVTSNFQPPQFFIRLTDEHPVLLTLRTEANWGNESLSSPSLLHIPCSC